jgi:hypothetical protein
VPLGDSPLKLDGAFSIVAPKGVLVLGSKESRFLCVSQSVSRLVSYGSQHFLGFRNIVPMNQNVEVIELPKREVTIDRSGQSWTFVGDSRYHMRFEFVQDSEQFSAKEKVAQAVGTKVLSKASQSIFRDTIRTCSVEVPVQEWRYSMPVCRSEQVLPIDAFLEQGLDSGGCL